MLLPRSTSFSFLLCGEAASGPNNYEKYFFTDKYCSECCLEGNSLPTLQNHLQSQSWGHMHDKPCITRNYTLLKALLTVWQTAIWEIRLETECTWGFGLWSSSPGFLKHNQVKPSSASHQAKPNRITFNNFHVHPHWSKYELLFLGLYLLDFDRFLRL